MTASSWLNDLRDQVERNRVLNVIYRSATALGSRLPSISNAKARVVGAGALLRPVSSGTQVYYKIFNAWLIHKMTRFWNFFIMKQNLLFDS